MVTFMRDETLREVRNATTKVAINAGAAIMVLSTVLYCSGMLDKPAERGVLLMTGMLLIMTGATIRMNVNAERAENQQRRWM